MRILALFCMLIPHVMHAQSSDMRIISIGGRITETVYALGFGDKVVGADITSIYPAEVADKPRLPFLGRLTAEPVLSLKPTHIIHSDEAGPREVLDQLAGLGITLVSVTDEEDFPAADERMNIVAQALGTIVPASLKGIQDRVPTVTDSLRSIASFDNKKVLFIYSRGPNVTFVAGKNSGAQRMIEAAGAVNAIDSFEEMKPISTEFVAYANPDVVVMLERGVRSIGGAENVWTLPGLQFTKAYKTQSLVTMPDDLFLSFGPRTIEAIRLLHTKLTQLPAHP